MNDLTLSAGMAQAFPSLYEGLRKAQSILDSIQSFEDIERVFLLGAGLSPNTYRSYLQAVKQFYHFTEGKHPLQVRPGDIEAFYDDLVQRVDRNTAYLRIRGLKKFFEGIRNVLPIYTSPFEIMPEKLHEKLNRTRKGNRTKKALSIAELRALLAWLEEDRSPRGLEDYAIVYMLATSGLRASELCSLRWQDLDFSDGTWTARFTGKGGLAAEQELYAPAVEACRRYFIAARMGGCSSRGCALLDCALDSWRPAATNALPRSLGPRAEDRRPGSRRGDPQAGAAVLAAPVPPIVRDGALQVGHGVEGDPGEDAAREHRGSHAALHRRWGAGESALRQDPAGHGSLNLYSAPGKAHGGKDHETTVHSVLCFHPLPCRR